MTVVEELLAAGLPLTPCLLLRLSHEKGPVEDDRDAEGRNHPIGRSARKNERYLFYLVCPCTRYFFVRNSALISRYISGNVFYG